MAQFVDVAEERQSVTCYLAQNGTSDEAGSVLFGERLEGRLEGDLKGA